MAILGMARVAKGGMNAHTHAHTQRKTTDDGGVCVAVSPYSMTRSFEAFGLSANS